MNVIKVCIQVSIHTNMHEIGYSLNRQFGPEEWTLYKGLPLYNFVDNHDVERIASQLEDKEHLPLIYAMEFAMPRSSRCLLWK